MVNFGADPAKGNMFITNIIELQLTNNLDNLDVFLSINQTVIKNVSIKSRGKKKLFVEFDRALLKEKNSIEIESSHDQWAIKRLKLKNCFGFSFGLLSFNIVNKNKIGKHNEWQENTPSFERFILLLILSFVFIFYHCQ